MKRTILLVAFLAAGTGLFACEMSFFLDGEAIRPGARINLAEGSTHTLVVRFTEDHGNCRVSPDETVFLVNEEKWKTSKSHLPLVLTESIVWKDLAIRTHEAVITFQAALTGNAAMEIIRDCPKAGYDEKIYFTVF